MVGKNRTRKGKLGGMLGGRKEESSRNHGAAARERHTDILLVGHDLMVIYRLIEMG